MEYTEEQKQKLKEISIDILKEFIRICDKHNLTYFAAYGTAIGAVRHKGFIPWDDDMDVIMPRPDYDKFVEIAKTEMDEKYGLAGAEIQKEIQGFYLQMYRKGTTWMTKWNAKWKFHVGVKLDIFPYDCVPASGKARQKLYNKTRIINYLYKIRNVKIPYYEGKSLKVTILKCIDALTYAGLIICRVSVDRLVDEYVRLMTSYEGTSKYRTLINWGTPDKWIIRDDEIYPLQECEFEGLTIKLPAKNHEILTRQYGDYMQVPPEEERVGHELAGLDFGEL